MTSSSFHESYDKKNDEISVDVERQLRRRKQLDEVTVEVPRFLFRLGREPIALSPVEYRIVRFLASKPYKAFRRDQIVAVVHTEEFPVTDDNLDGHIRSLRDKLGLFSDYVQTVPYIGFRFKP